MTTLPRRIAGTTLHATIVVSLVLPLLVSAAPLASGSGGAVATISEPASKAALAILDKGGNAVDAAVAAAAALGVTEPFSCGIGGGGFMMIYLAKDKRVISIDHRETAPAAFTSSAFLDNGQAIDFDQAVSSGMAVGVPGTVRGWQEALSRYGTMSMKQVLAPAVGIASQGFPVDQKMNQFIVRNEKRFSLFSSTSALYLKDGKALAAGSLFRNPDLAKAYRELGSGGVKAFYEGKIGRAIVAAVNQPPLIQGASVRAGNMTMADLANYEARLRQPVRSSYRGYDLYGMPLPSSGGMVVAEALNILEAYDLKSMPKDKVEHLYLEASRLAFADRNAYLADPEYVDAPVVGLLSKEYAAVRRQQINPEQAGVGKAGPGDPYEFQQDPSVPLRPVASRLLNESAHTTHLTVSDKEGNIVSYTFTIESWGGSGIVVPGYGFLLNNEMTDFDFSGPHPNVPEAGKRPRSSMAPTIVFKNGKPAFTIGSPGGSTIITTVLQTIVNHIDLGMTMDQALNSPRLSQRNGGVTDTEGDFVGKAQAAALEKYGHTWGKHDEIGAANAIVFHPDGSVTAVSEAHRHGIGSALVQKPAH
ncbi:MAG: gamma-glutamyltransferase [Pseudomonadota bacterium]